MPYNQNLYNRLKQFFSNIPNIKEKKMFGRIAFMVNGKICVTVGADRIMCRIDPELHNEALKKYGTKTVQMGGSDYKGYVHVAEDAIATKKELDCWRSGFVLATIKELKHLRKRKKLPDEEISCKSLFQSRHFSSFLYCLLSMPVVVSNF